MFNHVDINLPSLERETIDGVRYYKVPDDEDWASISLLPTERFIDRRGKKYPKYRAWK